MSQAHKSPTQTKRWNTSLIKQFERESKQALFRDKQTLAFFSQDFGHLIDSTPAAVCIPQCTDDLISVVKFANQNQLPLTLRSKGLSQGGQSLALPGGLTVSMQKFVNTSEVEEGTIWAEANSSWADILSKTLVSNKAPFVVPYNCNLSVAGVLSAAGVGASSFKYGTVSAHVDALEVVDGLGQIQQVERGSPLFAACLSGQGLFGVITKAKIQLKTVKPQVKTFFLVYADQDQWFQDAELIQDSADYLELFCSPSIQAAVVKGTKRVPIAQWLYALQVSVAYDSKAPSQNEVIGHLKPWQVLTTQEESISSYVLRHNSRLDMMKCLGQWDLLHPWYECFVPTEGLKLHLSEILQELPLHFANLVHVVPIAKRAAGFLMLPDAQSICSLMIINPGQQEPLKDSCLEAIKALDSRLMPLGGKRYLSGFLGNDLEQSYWVKHFGSQYSSWMAMKNRFDPAGVFSSVQFSSLMGASALKVV